MTKRNDNGTAGCWNVHPGVPGNHCHGDPVHYGQDDTNGRGDERKVTSLEIKNQAALKSAITALRGFGMAAEEALEEWVFDQNLFRESADSVEGPAEEPAKPRPGRKQKKEQDTVAEDRSGDEP